MVIITLFFVVMVISGIGSYITNERRGYEGKTSFMYKANILETRDDVEVYSIEIGLLKALLGKKESYKYTIMSIKDSTKKVEDDLAIKYKNIIKDAKNIGLDEKKFVLLDTKIVKEKSKSLMIVAIGMMLGLFLGIFAAFIKEFFENVDLKS